MSDRTPEGVPAASSDPSTQAPGESSSEGFIGRARELADLRSGLEQIQAGRGQAFLVGGEPGVGKTRLADELSEMAQQQEIGTWWGRCWEAGGAPPFWPWIQILRSLWEQEPRWLEENLGPGVEHLAAILPELRQHLPKGVEPATIETDGDRFLLFEAVAGVLKRMSGQRPLVIVVDDVHAADHPSVLLLTFLAREIRGARLLLYATHRPPEVRTRPEIAEALGRLGREASLITLAGLPRSEVRRFMQRQSGVPTDDALVAKIHEITEGNPFFLTQLVYLLQQDSDLGRAVRAGERVPIPEGVRQAVRQRLAMLPEASLVTLSRASILGRDFSREILAHLQGEDDPAQALGEGITAGVLVKGPSALAPYRFAHTLYRDTLYEEIPASERAELHAQAAELLERAYGSDADPHIAEIAHHLYEAGPRVEPERALDAAFRAAHRAESMAAHHEAARWYERALGVLQREGDDPGRRNQILISLGTALNRGGDVPAARKEFLRAVETARKLEDPELLASAAIGYGRQTWTSGVVDQQVVALLEESIKALPEEDTALRVNVLTRLVVELVYSTEHDRRLALAEEAVQRAERIGDPETLSDALEGRGFALAGPDTVGDWLTVGSDVIRLAGPAGRRELVASGHIWRLAAHLTLGDIAAFDRELGSYLVLVDELKEPNHQWYGAMIRATRALLTGSLDEGERLIQEAHAIGQHVRADESSMYHDVQTFVARALRGGPEGMEESYRGFRERGDQLPGMPAFRAIAAYALATLGRDSEARSELESIAADSFSALQKNIDWLGTMALLSEAAAALGDADRAETLYRLLLPYAERHAIFDWSIVSMGSISRHLGMLATLAGKYEEAVDHFEAAIEANTRMRARPFVALARHDYAKLLALRDRQGDRTHGQELAAQAIEAYREIGMNGHVEGAELLLAELGGAPIPKGVAVEGRVRPSVFRREGEYWSVSFEGEAFRLKDAKGFSYLARLLSEPGREFHALDLFTSSAGAGEPAAQEGLSVSSGEAAGPVLDAEAKAAYRRRLEDLDEEIEQAEANNDPERAAKAAEERDFFVRELASAVGLGGRDRPSDSAAERARVNVTKAIRSAVRRVEEHSKPLGQHLERTLRTGTFCSYQPDPRSPVNWRIEAR